MALHLGLYGSAQVGSAFLALILVATLGRFLGRSGFGEYSFAFVVASFGGLIADFGIGPWLTRAIAQRPGAASSLLHDVLGFRAKTLLLAWTITLGLSAAYLRDGHRVAEIAVLLGYLTALGYSVVYESQLMGGGWTGRVSISVFVGKALELGAVLGWLAAGGGKDVFSLGLALVGGACLRLLLVWALARDAIAAQGKMGGSPSVGGEAGRFHRLLQELAPFALGAVVWTAYFKVDIVLLERFGDPVGLGLYAAAFRVLEALLLIPRSVVGVLYPVIAGAWGDQTLGFSLLSRPARGLVAVALSAAAGLCVLAPQVMTFLFGSAFAPGAGALRILAGALVLVFLNQYLGMILVATHRQAEWMRVTAVGLVVNVAANLVLIPALGFEGAAWATLVSEGVIVGGLGFLVTRSYGWPFSLGWALRAVTACAMMVVVIRFLHWSLLPRVGVGAIVFVVASVVLGVVSAEERALARKIWRRIAGRLAPVDSEGFYP